VQRPRFKAAPMSMDEPNEDADRSTVDASGLLNRVAAELARHLGDPLAPGLYLIATPIGNLADISLRALATLARSDVVYCEDTRHSRTLVAHYGIGRTLRPYHEHNAEEQRPRILADLARGARISLISDAGTPLVSDPGYKLVRDAIADSHTVIAIPGASAVLTALPVAGLPTDTFLFAGFLPPRSGARRSRISELATVPASLIFFEAPTRVAETLTDLAQTLGDRPAAVARELTKLHEDVRRGTLTALAERFAQSEPKGEIVIVVGPPGAITATDEAISAALQDALALMSLRDAAKAVAERLSVPKARVYDLGLKLKTDRP
jgi:16S rRNA (cytidine1402-2'-O)-methyltransferase